MTATLLDVAPEPLPPWLAEMVDVAVAPYRGKVSDDDLAWMREELASRLVDDPELARMADDARDRGPVDESGKILRRDVLDGLDLDREGPDAQGDGSARRAAGGGRRDA